MVYPLVRFGLDIILGGLAGAWMALWGIDHDWSTKKVSLLALPLGVFVGALVTIIATI